MNLDFDDSKLDEFLKQKLGDFRKTPDAEHWQQFERNFEPKQVSLQRFNRYRIALWSSVAVAALILIILLIRPEIATIPSTSPLSTKLEKQNQTDGLKSGKNNQSTYSGHEKQSQKRSEVPVFIRPSSPDSASIPKTPCNSANSVQPVPVVPEQKQRKNDEYRLLAGLDASELPVKISNRIEKTDQTLISKHVSQKSVPEKHAPTKNKSTNHLPLFSRKHSTRNLFYSRKPSQNWLAGRHQHRATANPSAMARFFSKLEYKLNVTPQYCGQTLNNKGGIAVNDFDPQFYRSIENGKLTFAGGLEIVYPIDDRWSIYTGLKISTYKRETTNNLSHLKVSNDQIAIPTSAGDISIHGLTSAQVSSQDVFKSVLTLQNIELPVVFRRQLNKSVYIDAGLKYSYIFSTKTQTKLTGENKPFTYDQLSDIHDQNLSLVVGTGVTFITGSGLKFDTGPEICWNVTNLNPSSNLVSKPLTLGLRTTISLERFQRN